MPAAAPLARDLPFVSPAPAAAEGEGDLAGLIAAGAKQEGCTDLLSPGLRYSRYSLPSSFYKTAAPGLVLTVVAQGKKIARWRKAEVVYDPDHYLLITGDGAFEGRILEASPARPFLAAMVTIPPEVVAKTLLALADSSTPPAEPAPAFVAPLDPVIKSGVVRLLQAVVDPVERRILAPLVLEELVFRLLRSDAAAVVRSAVGHAHDADQIQKAMQFMRANATTTISVEKVARHVAMSPSHFAHRFRAVARTSPMRYMKKIRMDQARALMVVDGARVSEAASKVGYESVAHFSRDFKLMFGFAPVEYVRRFRAP
jgi:AraC-like DNA-binding protein